MKKVFTSILALFAIIASGSTVAKTPSKQVLIQSRFIQFATTGPEFGAGLGWGTLDTPTSYVPAIAGNTDMQQSRTLDHFVWEGHAGYDFAVSPRSVVKFKVGYKDLGESQYKTTRPNEERKVTISQQKVDFLIGGQFFVYNGLNIFANGGAAIVGSKEKQRYNNSAWTPDQNSIFNWSKTTWKLRPEIEIGTGLMVNKNVNIFVLFDHVFPGNETNNWIFSDRGKFNVYGSNSVMAGVEVKFPILSQTPQIGWLFKKAQDKKSDVLILTTPRIVHLNSE